MVPGVGYPCTHNPQDFWSAYDVGSTPTGASTNIAIFAEGDLTQVVKDLRQEEAVNKLAQVPVSIRRVGVASPDTSGADEWDLDTQYSSGMAATVHTLYVYDTTTLTDSDIAREFIAFVSQDVAKAGSASFGECEDQAYLDGSMLADDEAFAEAAAQGQTVFASAGDTGGFCAVAPTNGVPAGAPFVNYPASSPYVVGVGGTTLVTNANGSDDTGRVAGGWRRAQPVRRTGDVRRDAHEQADRHETRRLFVLTPAGRDRVAGARVTRTPTLPGVPRLPGLPIGRPPSVSLQLHP